MLCGYPLDIPHNGGSGHSVPSALQYMCLLVNVVNVDVVSGALQTSCRHTSQLHSVLQTFRRLSEVVRQGRFESCMKHVH